MSDTTIFKLGDLGISSYSNIKVKSKKTNETSSFSNIIYKALDTPTITLNGDILSWSSISDATSYNIYVNNTLETNTSYTSYDLTDLQLSTGAYTISIRAIDDNGVYTNSDMSNTVGYSIGSSNCLAFVSQNTFTLKFMDGLQNSFSWNGTIEYSPDNQHWSTWDDPTMIINSSLNGSLFLRGTNNSYFNNSSGLIQNAILNLTGNNIECSGNIENLLDYQTVANGNHPTMDTYCYANLFYNCTSLTTAPELPATTLANYCYYEMFYNCSSLTTAPELPATTLAPYCYYEMFCNCSSLTTAPELPATTLKEKCYQGMFSDCISLTIPPIIGNGTTQVTPAKNCCSYMFYDCSSLKIYTSSSNHTAFYVSMAYSTSVSSETFQSSYQMFYNCYVNGSKSTANYLTAGTQYYY